MYSPVRHIEKRRRLFCLLYDQSEYSQQEGKGEEDRTWQEIPEAGAVVFPDAVEHNGPGRHVHPHGESLGGKQHLTDRETHVW